MVRTPFLLLLLLFFDRVSARSDTLVPFRTPQGIGYANRRGELRIPPKYGIARPFTGGAAIVGRSDSTALIDPSGRELIPLHRQLLMKVPGSNNWYYRAVADTQSAGEPGILYGVVRADGQELIPARWHYIRYQDGIFEVMHDGRSGLLTAAGTVLVPPQFRHIKRDESGWVATNDSAQALFDRSGQQRTPFVYMLIQSPQEGLRKARIGDRFGFINDRGETRIPFEYELVYGFREGWAAAQKQGRWGLIDRQGRTHLAPEYEEIGDVHQGLVAARKNGRWQVIDAPSGVVVADTLHEILRGGTGPLMARESGGWSARGNKGQRLTEVRYDSVVIPENTLRHIRDFGWKKAEYDTGQVAVRKGSRWGILGPDGREALPVLFEDYYPFTQGLALAKTREGWAIYSRGGKRRSAVYEELEPFIGRYKFWNEQGVLMYRKGKAWGLLDRSGKERTPALYDHMTPDSEGNFLVARQGKCGLIDKTGKQLVPLRYRRIQLQAADDGRRSRALFVVNGLALVVGADGKESYVGTDGTSYFRD